MSLKQLEFYVASFILLILFVPYFVTIETLLGGSGLRILAPLWGLLVSGGILQIELPLSLTLDYVLFWGWNFLYLFVVLISLRSNDELTIRGYVFRVGFVVLLQILTYSYILMNLVNGPPTTIIPLPIPAIVAFILTPRIIGKRYGLWNEGSSSPD